MDRRGFLTAVGQLAAGAASIQLEGITALVKAAAHSGTRQQALTGLLLRRDQLMYTDENANLQGLWMDYHEDLIELRSKHLASLDDNAALLNPNEAFAFKQDLAALQRRHHAAQVSINEELRSIDATLKQYPNELGKIAASPPPSLKEVSSGTMHDARALAKGKDAPALAMEANRMNSVSQQVQGLEADLAKVMQTPPSNDVRQRRTQALHSSISRTLKALLEIPGVSIESSLTRSYGPDHWTLRSRMKQADIGGPLDKSITKHFNDLTQDLRKAYPERFMDRQSPLLTRSRPLQPGYGDYDCERLVIQGPDFSLREILKKAENSYLIHYNKQNAAIAGLAR
jgi:hypothetical protein